MWILVIVSWISVGYQGGSEGISGVTMHDMASRESCTAAIQTLHDEMNAWKAGNKWRAFCVPK